MSNGFSFSRQIAVDAAMQAVAQQAEISTKPVAGDEELLPAEFEHVPYQPFVNNGELSEIITLVPAERHEIKSGLAGLILQAGGGSVKHGLRQITLQIREYGQATVRNIKLIDVPHSLHPFLESMFNPVLSNTGKSCFFRPGYFKMNINAMRRILTGKDKQTVPHVLAQGYNSARIKWPHDAHVIMAKEGYRYRITLDIKGIITDVYPQMPTAVKQSGVDID